MKLILTITLSFFCGSVIAQIPVEIFGGDKKATFDILFFKFFKNKEKQNTNFLFFNRNRVTIDYLQTTTSNLPQFGFTEAISYNHKRLKGFGAVAVAQINNKSIYPKLGIQFAKVKTDVTVFTWVVVETLQQPNIDFFFLSRYTPKLSEKVNLFTQLELVNALPTIESSSFTFIQRIRLGLKLQDFQFGLGADFTEIGRDKYTSTQNIGAFLRHEF